MQLLLPDWRNAPDNVAAFTTMRQGGVSVAPCDDGQGGGGLNLGDHVEDDPARVAENRRRLRSILPAEPVWLTQVHGTVVRDAADAGGAVVADASIAHRAGVVCAMMTADCLPVLFCDTAGSVVGAAHAGWRGLVGGVLENTVAAMRARGAGDIMAWLGPAIGPQRFEVGSDVLDAFTAYDAHSKTAFAAIAGRDGKYLADIYQLARRRLQQVGVDQISGGDHCTVIEAHSFYSYRRDRLTGRMTSLIWLK
ncbi:peptidoglycan editing factor PgeF [Herbaspirillum autotrophicum]|uniref:peptidoglycan editing factor PgeF n=1 Tax=Herbaspirillum autotrophicum TaxID=180195 RepID=UPI00067B0E4A|nr:peptidoglycan editing factor PgeF [Herbaspirillum autotrophicum]